LKRNIDTNKVFLRLLEYYNGVLILTTNRSSNIDEAFESRIDVTLAYSDLGEVDREKIWENLLRTRTADVKSEEEEEEYCRLGEVDIKKLAKRQLNGRQIKSAVKTAHLLAAHKREPLALEHLEVVLQIREKARQVIGDKRAEYIRTGSSDSGNSPKTKVMYEVS
jgi:SpoVK/Ycf46/Vps4 family AAA+-type ATPase